jgi:hypothetical protein
MNNARTQPLNLYLMLTAAAWGRAVREDSTRGNMNGDDQPKEHEVFAQSGAFEKRIVCEFCGPRGMCGWCAECEERVQYA